MTEEVSMKSVLGWARVPFLAVAAACLLAVAGSAAAGMDAEFGRGDLTLLRYTADGKLDASFGTGGQLRADAGVPEAVAIQPDHKLVTAGVRPGPNHREDPRVFALARC